MALATICSLDTSAYSHLQRGHEALIDAMARASVVLISTIVLGELIAGFRLGSRYQQNERLLRQFLEEPFVTIAPVTPEVSSRYGEIFTKLRRAGTPIPTNDIWIAATTLDARAELLTFDSDYQTIEGLRLNLLSK